MADPFAIIALINTHHADLEAALGPGGPAFFNQVDRLFQRARDVAADMNAQGQVGDDLLALVDRYPGARAVLRAADPATFGALTPADAPPAPPADPAPTGHAGLRAPGPEEAAGTGGSLPVAAPGGDGSAGTAASVDSADAADSRPPPAPEATESPAANSPSGTGPVTISLAPPPGTPAAPPAAPGAGTPGSPGPAAPPAQVTPGDVTLAERLQLRKETVATVLALLVVGGTVGLALITILFMRGSDLSTAKDVLVVMSSLAGVVLGYYFGRIPSDARAEQSAQQAQQAQQVAATARSAAQNVGERALQMANEVSRIREALALQTARGTTRDIAAAAEPAADTIGGLQTLQNDLENLARQARQV